MLGSPFYGELLDILADDVTSGGPLADVLADFADSPGPAAIALRLAGTAHRLALDGEAPGLARHFPSTGGDGDAVAAAAELVALARSRPGELRAGLDLAPQTNETGRAAALLGALLYVSDEALPVRIWEIGASGGLNLLADRFRYVAADGRTWGPPSPVVLDPAWDAPPAGAPETIDVIERVVGDVAPVDPTADPRRLEAYVWPDQPERLARLRGALELGSGASDERPFAHIAFEPRRLTADGQVSCSASRSAARSAAMRSQSASTCSRSSSGVPVPSRTTSAAARLTSSSTWAAIRPRASSSLSPRPSTSRRSRRSAGASTTTRTWKRSA